MQVPLALFLYVYLGIVFGIVVFSIISVTQALRFGLRSFAATLMSITYLVVIVVLLIVTWSAVRGVDWSSSFSIDLPGIAMSTSV
ncbi:MAG: hypothetical protein V1907_05150 [Candidatus Kerfeldbacteria bacterium]